MLKATGRIFGLVLLALTAGFSHASAQSTSQKDGEYYDKAGSLGVWTKENVFRKKFGENPEFLTVRFGKHTGFDRVVFEFKGDLTGYFVNFSRPPFESEGGESVTRVRGKAFAEIELYPVRSSDENVEANERALVMLNKIKLPVIREVKQVEWFEGELRYVVGLYRSTPFRVQVFSNPTRLVVDFRH